MTFAKLNQIPRPNVASMFATARDFFNAPEDGDLTDMQTLVSEADLASPSASELKCKPLTTTERAESDMLHCVRDALYASD